LGGLNIPRFNGGGDNPLSSGWQSRTGPAFGILASFELRHNFALQTELLYSSEGGMRNGMQAIDAKSINPQVPAGTYFYANFDNESILNYLELPVMLKYSFPLSKSSSFYLDFGPYIGILLNGRQITNGSSAIYADAGGTQQIAPQSPFSADTDITDDIKGFNFGITGGVGFSKDIWIGDIILDIRGAYGITTIQKDTENGRSHIGNVLVAIGYAVPL